MFFQTLMKNGLLLTSQRPLQWPRTAFCDPRPQLCLNVTSLLFCITTSLAPVIGGLAGFNPRSLERPPRSSSPQPDASATPPARAHPSCRGSSLPPPAAVQTWREGRGEGRSLAAECSALLLVNLRLCRRIQP